MSRMVREEVLQKIAAHDAEFRAMGVVRLLLFGSVARGEEGPDSDVDFLVEFDGRPVGYFHLFDVQRRLEQILQRKVDLLTVGGLRREIRDEVMAEAVRAA
jgi:uncharacterized protein